MSRRLALSLALAALVVSTSSWAEIMPRPGRGDPHIQWAPYDPQEVVALHVAAGYATTVQFSQDERIETVTVGETTGWTVQVDHRAADLVVKPVGFPAPTNLTVLTDQRTYNFTLYGGTAVEGVQPYMVSFVYPTAAPAPAAPPSRARYRFRGSRALWPRSIRDDGKETYILWDAERPLPAVYREDERGHRALVNAVMKDGSYLVEGVHRRIIFIAGRDQASAERIEEKNVR